PNHSQVSFRTRSDLPHRRRPAAQRRKSGPGGMEKAPPPFPARLRAGFSIGMNKEQKREVVAQIAAQLQGASAVYAVDYRGLSVTQAAALRTSLRENGTSFRVVKNTLTLRAADERSEEHTSELQSPYDLVCRLLLEKK